MQRTELGLKLPAQKKITFNKAHTAVRQIASKQKQLWQLQFGAIYLISHTFHFIITCYWSESEIFLWRPELAFAHCTERNGEGQENRLKSYPGRKEVANGGVNHCI